MVSQLAQLYNEMNIDMFTILRTIESLMSKYEYPPIEVVEKRSRLPPGRFKEALGRLIELKLVRKSKHQLMGYTLTYQALDLLALRSLVLRGTISELGPKIGVGKESEVYDAITPTGLRVVLKFHREGTKSFKNVRKTRSFMINSTRKQWLLKAKLIGQREFKALDELYKSGALVPKPVDYNRHAVVQSYIEGVELQVVPKNGLDNPREVLRNILDTIKIAYRNVGIVHGDLSEYNILISTEGIPYVIDWPQYVYRSEPHADELLRRDVYYIIRFFKKRFNVEEDPEYIIAKIKGMG